MLLTSIFPPLLCQFFFSLNLNVAFISPLRLLVHLKVPINCKWEQNPRADIGMTRLMRQLLWHQAIISSYIHTNWSGLLRDMTTFSVFSCCLSFPFSSFYRPSFPNKVMCLMKDKHGPNNRMTITSCTPISQTVCWYVCFCFFFLFQFIVSVCHPFSHLLISDSTFHQLLVSSNSCHVKMQRARRHFFSHLANVTH